MVVRTTVRLPEELLRRAKRKAAAEGRTLTSLIEDGLRVVIADKALSGTRRLPLPVSKETGGLLPGVDATKFSALEERDDLERYGPMKRDK
jgi:hypothetical protein